jgi:hypothetical protein
LGSQASVGRLNAFFEAAFILFLRAIFSPAIALFFVLGIGLSAAIAFASAVPNWVTFVIGSVFLIVEIFASAMLISLFTEEQSVHVPTSWDLLANQRRLKIMALALPLTLIALIIL